VGASNEHPRYAERHLEVTMQLLRLVLLLSAASFALSPRVEAAQEAKEVPVYDEKADARADVAAAVARAGKENRRVLIQWGANWCGWCRLLHGTMATDKELRKELMYEYEVVRVDVGRFDKHMDFARELGAEFKGIPYLTVLDAAGKALVQQNTEPFELAGDGKGHDPAKLLEFLTKFQAPALEAAAVRDAALARAKAEGKRVFLHFGAPWCGWCHKLEGWMARPEIATLLGSEFIDLKIDTDRMVGGAEMLKSVRASAGLAEGAGIPWIAFLDAGGAVIAHSDGPQGNTGFPYKDEEIAHFVAMLGKARKSLTAENIETLRQSLVAVREADEARKKAAETDKGK
jgi:thiol-disulfide isomerase/thioredoxin